MHYINIICNTINKVLFFSEKEGERYLRLVLLNLKNKTSDFLVMIIFVLLISFSTLNILGCSKSTKEKQSKLSISINVTDKNTLSIIKLLISDYKKDKPETSIILNSIMGSGNISNDVISVNDSDIIFANRTSMIELANKGSLDELSKSYDKNKLLDRNYSIVNSYGRYGDKIYGIGLVPYSIEFYYNIDSLKSKNITIPQNYDDFIKMLATINKNSIKVPVLVTDDIDSNILLAAIEASNSISISKLDLIYNSNEENYKKLVEMQGVFDKVNELTKTIHLKKDDLEVGNEGAINDLKKGTTPVLISISYNNMKLDSPSVKLFDSYGKIDMPILMSCLICQTSTSKNSEEAGDFIKFAESDYFQKKLISKGFITGNKKANEGLSGNAKIISNHLTKGDNNSILFLYDLPNKFKAAISKKVGDIIDGKYNKTEWSDIVNSLF